MTRTHTRRKRRQANMALRSRGRFKVCHKSKSGRTGSVFSKRLASRRVEQAGKEDRKP